MKSLFECGVTTLVWDGSDYVGEVKSGSFSKRIQTIDSLVQAVESGGTRKDLVADHLGSILAEIDQSQTNTGGGRFGPYGTDVSSTGTRDRFRFVGGPGYRTTLLLFASNYMRHRHEDAQLGTFTTVDLFWPSEASYSYVNGRVGTKIDPKGFQGHGIVDPNYDNGRWSEWAGVWAGVEAIGHLLQCFACGALSGETGVAIANAYLKCNELGHREGSQTRDDCLENGPGGAYRHCTLECRLYRTCPDEAKDILNHHEERNRGGSKGSPAYLDACMDNYNNSVGKNLARYTKHSCESLCSLALKHGSLYMNSDWNYGLGKPRVNCDQWQVGFFLR